MNQLSIALKYAERGISVFPCHHATKSPLTKKGFYDGTTDKKVIKRLWGRFPYALVGASNDQFTVVDIDIGKACPASKILTENAMDRVFELCEDLKAMVVKTMSNGYHIYFSKTEGVNRRINFLPNIDILGDGGYVILPDQKTYVAESDEPWEAIFDLDQLPKLDMDLLAVEMASATQLALEMKREASATSKKPSKPKKIKTKKEKPVLDMKDEDVINALVAQMNDRKGINYEESTMYLPQTPDMYKPAEDIEYAPQREFLVDGKLTIEPGTLDSKLVCELFHNREIQTALGKFLGLRVPAPGEKTSQRSVIPSHIDRRPSMGVRWHSNGTHMIIRDFSNHFGDPLEQVDYNIVRLYATMRYGCQAPRLRPPEFVVWFLRMLVDAGMLDVSHLMKKPVMPLPKGYDGVKKVLKSLILLDAIKQLYKDYNGETVFADRFASAWSGVPPSAVNRAKKAMVECSSIAVVGECDCSNGRRDDDFYMTNIYRIIDAEYVKERKEARVNKETLQKENVSMSSITLKGIRVSKATHDTIVNFCTDHKIPNVPLRENMFVEVCIIDGLVANRDKSVELKTYYMGELELAIVESISDGVSRVLMVVGESESLERLFYDTCDQYRNSHKLISDEPSIAFVISSDIEDADLDLDYLAARLTEYLRDTVVLDEEFTSYVTESGLNFVLDGMVPEED